MRNLCRRERAGKLVYRIEIVVVTEPMSSMSVHTLKKLQMVRGKEGAIVTTLRRLQKRGHRKEENKKCFFSYLV